MQQSSIPQLFFLIHSNKLVPFICKIVDDLLFTGEDYTEASVFTMLGNHFSFGTMPTGPGTLRYYGLNIVQNNNFTATIDGNKKLNALECFPLS